MKDELKKFLNGIIKYDSDGQFLWLVDKKDNHQKIADLRGWGKIQYLFKNEKDAMDFQDILGEFIADAINNKIKEL